jgi:hypothetical protein
MITFGGVLKLRQVTDQKKKKKKNSSYEDGILLI